MTNIIKTGLTAFIALAGAYLGGCGHFQPQSLGNDQYGQAIRYVEDPLEARCSATYEKNEPVIRCNPEWLGKLPYDFQQFAVNHELGHLVYDHPHENDIPVIEAETQADDYAIRKLKSEDIDIGEIIKEFTLRYRYSGERIENLTKLKKQLKKE